MPACSDRTAWPRWAMEVISTSFSRSFDGLVLDGVGQLEPVHLGHLHIEHRDDRRAAGVEAAAIISSASDARVVMSHAMPQARVCARTRCRLVWLSSTARAYSPRRSSRGVGTAI